MNKNIGEYILIAIMVEAVILLCFMLEALVVWGVGAFVCHVFDINYVWTYLHSLATTLVLTIVGSFFKNSNNNK